jgi:hypothetical protein
MVILLNRPAPLAAEKEAEEGGINLYEDIPEYPLSLDEFEMLALKRLRVSGVTVSESVYINNTCQCWHCALHSAI